MQHCPACGQALAGIPGVPEEVGGRFGQDVRCPECGYAMPAGIRFLIGFRTSQPFPRRIDWLPRSVALLISNDGLSFLLGGVLGLAGLLYLGSVTIDVLRGIRPGFGLGHLLVAGVAALLSAFAVRGVRLRLRAGSSGDAAPPRPWRVLEASAAGVRWCDGAPPPRGTDAGGGGGLVAGIATQVTSCGPANVRTIRLVELFPSGTGVLVQAIGYLRPELGTPSQSDALYCVLPAGAASRISAALMDAIRGREHGARAAGLDVERNVTRTIVIEGSARRPRRGPEYGTRGLGCFIGVFVFAALLAFANPCTAVFIGALLLLVAIGHVYGTPGINRVVWNVSAGAIHRQGRWPIVAERVARIEVEVDRGVPVLRVVRKGGWLRTRPRLVPDDWGGVEPAEFAREVEAVLRGPRV